MKDVEVRRRCYAAAGRAHLHELEEGVHDVRLVELADRLKKQLLLVEAQREPRAQSIDGHHPEDAHIVPLQRGDVVDYVHVDAVQRYRDREQHAHRAQRPEHDQRVVRVLEDLCDAVDGAGFSLGGGGQRAHGEDA